MTLTAQCRLCNSTLRYSNNDPSPLGDHLLKEHPGVSVTHFSCNTGPGGACDGPTMTATTASVSARSSFVRSENTTAVAPNRHKLYKMTIETWRPGYCAVVCPNCGKTEQPIVRRQKNKFSKSPCGGLLLFGCWPFCFLPFCCSFATVDLYCNNCKQLLGSYDRKTGKVKPIEVKSKEQYKKLFNKQT